MLLFAHASKELTMIFSIITHYLFLVEAATSTRVLLLDS